MNEKYRLIKAYQDNQLIRESFNGLAKTIFDLDFEDWYQNGYWGNNYIPYSILDGNRVVANVSVSPMKFSQNGKVMNLLQLGTVMCYKDYRKQGLIRELINEIEHDYQDKADGWFLFANESVLEFYPKFGYRRASEYEYFKEVNNDTEMTAQTISMKEKEHRMQLEDAIRMGEIQSDFCPLEHLEIVMFYVTKFMSNNVYKVESQNAYVIAEMGDEELYIHEVIAPHKVDMDEVIAAFGKNIKKVVLGFTPVCKEGYKVKELKQKDTTLFIKGDCLEKIEKSYLRIPTLAHT